MTGAERCACGDPQCTKGCALVDEPKPLREIRHLPDGWWITKEDVGRLPHYYVTADHHSRSWEVDPYAFGALVWQLAQERIDLRTERIMLLVDADASQHWRTRALRAEAELLETIEQRDAFRARAKRMECVASADGFCALRNRPHANCPQCGPHVAIDGDGCCVTCGADAVPINAAGECEQCGAGVESGDGHNEGCDYCEEKRDADKA